MALTSRPASPSQLAPPLLDKQNSEEIVRAHLCATAEVQRRTAALCAGDVVRAAELVAEAISAGGKVLICGNGGSAADSQHLAAEFVSRLTVDFPRPGIPAIALTTDTSFLTAYANDIDFDGTFARQVETLGNPGDVLIGISTSGRSRNVLRAVAQARRRGLVVVALTGDAGMNGEVADVVIRVASPDTQNIQESHIAIEHILCHLVERYLYGQSSDERP